MKRIFQLSLLVGLLFTTTAFNNNLTAQKIAVVDTEALLASSPEMKRANSQLQALKKQFEKRLQGQYERMQTKYSAALQKAQAGTLTKAEEASISQELQKMQEDIAKAEGKMQQDLLKKEEEYIKPILEKIRKNITAVAKSKGFSYVFNKNAMIYHPPGDDITSLVKAKLGYK